MPVLKDELIMDRLITNSIRNRVDGLRKEMAELEAETKPIQDSLDTLVRMQQRYVTSSKLLLDFHIAYICGDLHCIPFRLISAYA